MNDYLWDKSAEPDAEIEEFEEALSFIAYRPAATEIPLRLDRALDARRTRRIMRQRILAIAAAVAFMLLASGIWLTWQKFNRRAQLTEVAKGEQREAVQDVQEKNMNPAPPSTEQRREQHQLAATAPGVKNGFHLMRRAVHSRRLERINRPEDAAAPQETARTPRRELKTETPVDGEAAKEQIMLALQVASAKLNLAQRMAHGAPTR